MEEQLVNLIQLKGFPVFLEKSTGNHDAQPHGLEGPGVINTEGDAMAQLVGTDAGHRCELKSSNPHTWSALFCQAADQCFGIDPGSPQTEERLVRAAPDG